MTTTLAPRSEQVDTVTIIGASRRSRPTRRAPRSRIATVAAMAVIVILTVYFLFPLYWQITSSTKSSNELASTNGLLPSADPKIWQNLVDLFSFRDGVFGVWMLNSLLYAGVGGIVATVVSAATGYALAMLRFRGSKIVTAAVLVGTMVPATVLAFPLFLVLSRMQLIDTYWAVLLPSLVSPFSVFLARMFASQSVPMEVLEAARIDGAGELRIAATMASRLMMPGLITILLIQIVAIWNNFFLPLIVLTDDKKFPATLGLYIWNSRVTQVPEYQSLVIVGALVSSIPLIVLFLVLQRYWRSGLAAGAVKG